MTATQLPVRQPHSPVRPRWELPALAFLLAGTAALYLWDLSASGWANAFYSAAAQAGSQSWTAFLYGASDAAAAITVDKPPMSIWVMALSVRIFGLSPWSVLVPQALIGVATVGVLYASVRRRHTPGAALLAGTVLALTPVATLMFRFNNPDALLVLLLTMAAAAVLRAVEDGHTRWMVAAGALVGMAFLTKQLQAVLVLPGFALAYLWAAPVPLRRRLRDGLFAVITMVLTGGWWVALVELVPESARPWIGGSQSNSFLELTFGYNGLGRITGDEVGSVGPTAGISMWGQAGLGRLFDSDAGGQISWLIPAALVLSAAALWQGRKAPRTDSHRATLIVWTGWLIVTGLTFSLMAGIFHAYYTVALAPAVAALIGIGGSALWAERRRLAVSGLLAAATLGTTFWSATLLGRSGSWQPWLMPTVLALGVLATAAIGASVFAPKSRGLAPIALTLSLSTALLGPMAYSLQTASTAHTGGIVTAGPSLAHQGGFPGATTMGPGAHPGPGVPGAAGAPPAAQNGRIHPEAGGAGGLLDAAEPGEVLTALLLDDADSYTWVAATVGSNTAAGLQLATERPVMPIGGFNGSDPFPSLVSVQESVADGQIHYFVAGRDLGRQDGGSAAAQEISDWVTSNFTAQTVDGVTLYDLTD
jgi:4-amino-4-deoxy-L-arabinose transferase-like glycosyltransferase